VKFLAQECGSGKMIFFLASDAIFDPVPAGATFFFGETTVLPVNVFETRADDFFFAEMGDGLTLITKKSLL